MDHGTPDRAAQNQRPPRVLSAGRLERRGRATIGMEGLRRRLYPGGGQRAARAAGERSRPRARRRGAGPGGAVMKTIRNVLLVVVCAALAFGGTFTCRNDNDSARFTSNPSTGAD